MSRDTSDMAAARDGVTDLTAGFRDPATGEFRQETMIINMGPQHPSTHGVLRLLLELDGETVIRCKPVIGYLHTGIEKNTEYRTWVQGVAFVTRADYLSPFFNELGYCLGVERLLGIEAAAASPGDPRPGLRAQSDRLPPHLPRHRRPRTRRGLRDALRLPRARDHPRSVRGDHRAADEPRVHPAGRRADGPAGGGTAEDPRHPPHPARTHRRVRDAPGRQPDLA